MNYALRNFLADLAKAHPLTMPSNLVEIVERDIAEGKLEAPSPYLYAEMAGEHIYGSLDANALNGREDVLDWADEHGIGREDIVREWVSVMGDYVECLDSTEALKEATKTLARSFDIETPEEREKHLYTDLTR